jgi:hypothetical protein
VAWGSQSWVVRDKSFIIHDLEWHGRNRVLGHLFEMLVYRATEATTSRKHLPTYQY